MSESDQTSRERLFSQLSGNVPDRAFLWETGFWVSAVERWRKEGLPENADPYEFLGLDRVAIAGINWLAVPSLEETVLEDNEERAFIEDEVGGRFWRYKQKFAPGSRSVPIISQQQYSLRNRKTWNIIKSRLDPGSPSRWESLSVFAEGADIGTVPNSGFSGCYDPAAGLATGISAMTASYWLVRMAGFENAAMLLYDDPALVEEIYEYQTYFLSAQLKRLFSKRVPDILILNEHSAASKAGPFMSPEMYRRFAGPHIAQLTELALDNGVSFVIVNCAGKADLLIPVWIEHQVNGLMPLDVIAGTDPLAIRRKHPELALIGGIDRTALEGSKERIELEVLPKARLLFESGKVIPSGDAHFPISDRVSFDNMRFYVDLLRAAAKA